MKVRVTVTGTREDDTKWMMMSQEDESALEDVVGNWGQLIRHIPHTKAVNIHIERIEKEDWSGYR